MDDRQPASQPATSAPRGEQWFCVRSQPKHEHIAAAHLRKLGLVVFLPRIRFKRSTRRGPVWFTEALFPNYLFAKFDWMEKLGDVLHTRGVSTVIHFGRHWPVLSDSDLKGLREMAGDEELYILSDEFQPGQEVAVSGGAFHGLVGVVQKHLSGRQRVAVLLEFLGRQTQVEIDPGSLVRADAEPRTAVL